jgi:hypothetical protein
MGKRAANAHAAHRVMKKMDSPSVKETGGVEAATEKRTVSLLKQQLQERQRQLRIMASAKAH